MGVVVPVFGYTGDAVTGYPACFAGPHTGYNTGLSGL
jgi:hypothetical protein